MSDDAATGGITVIWGNRRATLTADEGMRLRDRLHAIAAESSSPAAELHRRMGLAPNAESGERVVNLNEAHLRADPDELRTVALTAIEDERKYGSLTPGLLAVGKMLEHQQWQPTGEL